MRLFRRLRFLLNPKAARDLAEEVEIHRAMAEDAQRAAGHTLEESQAAARRAMGNATLAREDARAVWIAPWLESIWQDLHYAARSLRAQPGFTGMALLALIMGLGLNTSLFSVINGLLLRPWPVPHPDRIARIFSVDPRLGLSGFSIVAARYFEANAKTVDGIFVERPYSVRLGMESSPVTVQFVSGNYFQLLDIPMHAGRAFSAADDTMGDPQSVIVLNYATWVSRVGADPGIIGGQIAIDDVPFTVIGVAASDFSGTTLGRTDLWAPLSSLTTARPNDASVRDLLTNANWCCSDVGGRLAPGATHEKMQAELTALFRQFRDDQRATPQDVVVGSATAFDPGRQRRIRPIVLLVLAAVGSILLLACANVSNLLLARSAVRQREIGVRAAMGASRIRIVRQLLTESLLLAAIASVAGLALAFWLPGVVLSRLSSAPANLQIIPDSMVLAYSLGIAVLTTMVFGLVPALRATGAGVSYVIKQQDPYTSSRFPLRGILLAVQVAISVVLLTAGALLLRGVEQARHTHLGFRADGVAAIRVSLPQNRYDDPAKEVFYSALVERARGMANGPVGISVLMPLGEGSSSTDFRPVDQNREVLPMRVQWINSQYFDILRIPIVAGRNFTQKERDGDAILVNETLARLYWADGSAVGRTVQIGRRTPTVVGIVGDAHVSGLGQVHPTYFSPFSASTQPVLLVPEALASSIVSLIRDQEPLAAVQSIALTDQVDLAIGGTRAATQAASFLGMLALLLSTVGVYGIVSYTVEQRRKEIGIRMALGALTRQVVSLILGRNARAIIVGLIVGLIASAGASKAIESQLYGVSRLDSVAYLGVLAILVLAGVGAGIIPVLRAARINAVISLHHD